MKLRSYEWVFLLVGLAAIDVFVWVHTDQLLYQAYQDWAFDATLRGLQPSIPRFAGDELYWMFGGTRPQRLPAEPAAASRPQSQQLSVIGRLSIPRLRVNVIVREGADEGTLSRAVGHIPGTALPGKLGNVALAGHRDTFFRPLRAIRAKDVIELETTSGTYRYRVESTNIVGPRDVGVLAASGGQTLTLVTCYPFYYVGSAPKRFVVHAARVNASQSRQEAAL
jgi:sortase A